MPNVDSLNEWNDPEFYPDTREEGRPQWFKLWVDKYVAALDIENLDNDLSQAEKEKLFGEIGKAFVNCLFYFMQHDQEKYLSYKPGTRDGRILWNALKRDIDQSFRDYEKRVMNGAKGGRPPKNKDLTE